MPFLSPSPALHYYDVASPVGLNQSRDPCPYEGRHSMQVDWLVAISITLCGIVEQTTYAASTRTRRAKETSLLPSPPQTKIDEIKRQIYLTLTNQLTKKKGLSFFLFSRGANRHRLTLAHTLGRVGHAVFFAKFSSSSPIRACAFAFAFRRS